MGVFRQLGDPVCPDCLCQHHEEAYAEHTSTIEAAQIGVMRDIIDDGATIAQVQIITTETCCIVVNAATLVYDTHPETDIEIERPKGTIRTTQEDSLLSDQLRLHHHAAWEVLPAGTYTYYLVQRAGHAQAIFGAWIKAVASDCLG